VSGCATAPQRPSSKDQLVLGRYRARWVDYQGQHVCAVSPKRLVEELEDADSLLEAFLSETSAGWRAVWTPEQVAVLEEGQKVLPAALATLERTHRAVAPCPFDRAYGFEALMTAGQKLIDQTRLRLGDAPALLNMAKSRQALEAWRKEQPDQREANRAQWCKEQPTSAKQPPSIFYATEDETGHRLYAFCDGAEVVVPPKGVGKVSAGAVRNSRAEAAYLEAVKRFPEQELLLAPKLPDIPSDQ
jgi:hypothetical protein